MNHYSSLYTLHSKPHITYFYNKKAFCSFLAYKRKKHIFHTRIRSKEREINNKVLLFTALILSCISTPQGIKNIKKPENKTTVVKKVSTPTHKDSNKTPQQTVSSLKSSATDSVQKKNYVAFRNLVKQNSSAMDWTEIAKRKMVWEDLEAIKILVAYDILTVPTLVYLRKEIEKGAFKTAEKIKIKQLIEIAMSTKGLKNIWAIQEHLDGTVKLALLKPVEVNFKFGENLKRHYIITGSRF